MIAFNRRILYQYIRRIAVDLLLTPFAFYLALLIQLDGQLTAQKLEAMSHAVLPITLVYIAINLFFGIYRRIWVYASFRDVILLSETIGLGTLILVVINVYVLPRYYYGLPTGSLVIGGLLFLTLSTMVKYRRQLMAILFASRSQSTGSRRERVLIVGINETAQQLATQIFLGKGKLNYELVGFVDDDLDGHGMTVNGVEILGAPEHVPKLVHDSQVDVIIIARQLSDREEMWQLISTCQETAAQVKVLPDMAQVIESGYKDPLTLRDVSINDLLGRAPASTCVESCRHILADKVVLVTGAAGSIGSELCRQILRFKPQSLLALDNNETGLHELNLELNQNGQSPLHLIMGDVVDRYKMDRVFHQYRPQVVFHAAAYKHVPLVEEHPDEALRVNVLGTVIVSEMAHQYKVERFVFISTDKAVNPSSVMGASKRIGELWVRSLKECSDTIFTTVRFGNVIGSRGSVVPTFARQIELGGPVTVTHPEMTRFFMSIPEAVSLVLQSATFGPSGEIFMLEMGEEVSVLNVARRMIRLKGLRVHKDIEIKFIGIRPGEKLHEELADSWEFTKETPHPSIYRIQSPNSTIDRQILLGVISILADGLSRIKAAQRVRDGIFQIASCDIDGFLNQVAGLDLMRDWRQPTDSDDMKAHTKEDVVRPVRQPIMGSTLAGCAS
jgi:FlaA1/EpsC-like NDP-sugar epimerase